MSIRYVRVKDNRTGHEYDVLEERLDEKHHKNLTSARYPIVSRPRAAKPFVGKGGENTAPGSRELGPDPSVAKLTARSPLSAIQDAAREAGINPDGLDKKQLLAAIDARPDAPTSAD